MRARPSPLETLLGSTSAEEFFRNHWNRRTFHSPNGSPSRLPFWGIGFGQLEFERCASALEAIDHKHAALGAAVYDGYAQAYLKVPGARRTRINYPAHQVEALLEQGATLNLHGLDAAHPAWARYADALAAELGGSASVLVAAFLSPAAAGSDLHFDQNPTFIVQIEGTKQWRVGREPSVSQPPGSVFNDEMLEQFRASYPELDVGLPQSNDLLDIELRPGDVLYVPAGTWHETLSQPGSLSISILIGGERPNRALAKEIEQALQPSSLRMVPRLASELERQQWIETALRTLEVTIPSIVADIADRYTTAPSSHEEASHDGSVLHPGLARDARLAMPKLLRYVVHHDPITLAAEILVTNGRKRLLLSGAALGLLEQLVEAPARFRAGDVMSWNGVEDLYAWEEVSDLLQAFLDAGLLTRDEG